MIELEKCGKAGCDVQVTRFFDGCCGDEVSVLCNKCGLRLDDVSTCAVEQMWSDEIKRSKEKNDN